MALAVCFALAVFAFICVVRSAAVSRPFHFFTSLTASTRGGQAGQAVQAGNEDPARAAQKRIINLLQSANVELDRANALLSEFELPVETATVSTELRAISWFIHELTGKLERGALDRRRQKDEL